MHSGGCRGSYDGGKIAGLYDLEETLGRGHFATVKLARHVFTGEKVAVKVIDKNKLDEISRAHLFQEVRCMKLVQHPNVVRLYEVIDTHTKLYLILELADGGDLYDYIMRHESGLSESVAQEYFAQILRAITYCHRLHVVHRDLKPENVVFFERIGVVKLTDFGFSNKFCPGQKLETSCGSLAYSAPEILLGDSYDAPAVDIWSLGVILYMLVCGQAPFQEANDSETLTMIMDCKYTIPNYISEECKRLIAKMLVREPEKRATLEQIANDPWLKNTLSDTSAVPLISRQNINDDDHSVIVQKMVNGGIATKEQILDALDKNAYNHITATYYLLAERKLRSQEPKIKFTSKQIPRVSLDICAENEIISTIPKSNHSLLEMPKTTLDITQRTRKCSIVAEEEENDDTASSDSSLHSSLNRRGSRSEGKLSLTVQELRKECMTNTSSNEPSICGSIIGTVSSPRASQILPNPLVSAHSSPQLGLEEIPDKSTIILPDLRTNFHSFKQKKNYLVKSQTAACSSSETSDEDSEKSKKCINSKSHYVRKYPRDPHRDNGPDGGHSSQMFDKPSSEQKPTKFCNRRNSNNVSSYSKSSNNYGKTHCLSIYRKRSTETYLQESKSLNCITEAKELETHSSSILILSPEKDTSEVKVCGVNKKKFKKTKKKSCSKCNVIMNKCLSLQKKLYIPFFRHDNLCKTQSISEKCNVSDFCHSIKSTLATQTK